MKHMQKSLSAFGCRRDGSVHTIFALAAVPMLFMIGAAVDYGRAAASYTKLQQGADGAVLAVAKLAQEGVSNADIKARAQAFLSASMSSVGGVISSGPTISADKSQVCLEAVASVNTAIMRIAGVATMPLRVTTCAAMADQTFEVALVLDTTRSMAASAGGVSKIQSLRSAATGFVDYMYTSSAMKTRTKISVVPFSHSVAVDPATYRTAAWLDQNGESPEHWRTWEKNKNIASAQAPTSRWSVYTWLKSANPSWDWAGCIESRAYPHNIQETAPTRSTPATLFVPALSPDENDPTSLWGNPYTNDYVADNAGSCTASSTDTKTKQWRACKYRSATVQSTSSSRGPNTICSTKPLMRLTDQSTPLKSLISSLDANGLTNIHEGLAWGWRSISPLAPFADGRAYDANNNNKIIVLMTDGENTWSNNDSTINGSEYSAYGYYSNANSRLPPTHQNVSSNTQARAAMDQLTRETCTNVRNAGVKIYTVGFSVRTDPIDAQGLQLLRDCAGAAERSFVATDGNELVKVFQEIAVGIGQLRLSR